MRRAAAAVIAIAMPGCFPSGHGDLIRQTDDDAGTRGPLQIDDSGTPPPDAPLTDPHALLGVTPNHGPFAGGQRALLRGNGFSSDARVWFGATEVASSDAVAVDPHRIQVTVPPGPPGAADVSVQDGADTSTRRTLSGGYSYDAFYVDPASGPTAGGTIVTLYGSGTAWTRDTTVSIDFKPCTSLEFVSATELRCTTPSDTAGAKSVRVAVPRAETIDVLDAFSYGDSDNGFRGGLSGNPIAGQLRVLALDNFSGDPLPGAHAIVDDGTTQTDRSTDASGLAVFASTGLQGKRTVTVAAKCHEPVTFVDVPVDTVTAYLDPILSPACASSGDPPAVGGTPGIESKITGQLVWKYQNEFEKTGWTNVPLPKSNDEARVAYVFRLSSDATSQFYLPSAISAVTPDSEGDVGYDFSLSSGSGNFAVYALAGLENRKQSPAVFTAYAMGMLRGVSVAPGQTTSDVFIPVDVPLDHALSVTVEGPAVTPRGPTQIRTNVAIRFGTLGYAILPGAQKTSLYPTSQAFDFVGVPALAGSISGAQYAVSSSAFSGQNQGAPLSVAELVATTESGGVAAGHFVEIPKLVSPANNSSWDAHGLTLDWATGSTPISLAVVEIESGGGLGSWTIATPGNKTVTLPDVGSFGDNYGIYPGPVTLQITTALIRDFDYGQLRYRQLSTRGWDAYATDVYFAHIDP